MQNEKNVPRIKPKLFQGRHESQRHKAIEKDVFFLGYTVKKNEPLPRNLSQGLGGAKPGSLLLEEQPSKRSFLQKILECFKR